MQTLIKPVAVEVEGGREGKDGEPSVGPVYRCILAKDGFPSSEPGKSTSWELFRLFSLNRSIET